MTLGIVGLGLIGGSFAKAYSKEGHTVLVKDIDTSMVSFATLSGAVHGELTKDNIASCDLVLVCVYPQAAIDFLEDFGPSIGSKPLVIDCCGTKRNVVDTAMAIARKDGFTYVGGHPMAGRQYSGFKHARSDMYHGAPMVIVPPNRDDLDLLLRIKELLAPAGFGTYTITTAREHDEMIAFTSQLAHIVSSAYIKSPTVKAHKGFSAGSYKDMTRVAWLNPQMWAELFLDNREYILNEIDIMIKNLQDYKDSIQDNDMDRLVRLLAEGKAIKEEVDGK